MQTTPLAQIKELEVGVLVVLRQQSDKDLPKEIKQLISTVKRNLTDARLDVRDAEYAENGDDYRRHMAAARVCLAKIVADILVLSQHNIFSPVEVAELTARLEIIGQAL